MQMKRNGVEPGKLRRQLVVSPVVVKELGNRRAMRSFFSLLLCAVLATAGMTTLGVIATPVPALALPGNSGVTSDPEVAFLETFERAQGATASGLKNYVGLAGQTHTAVPFWVTYAQCNGVILQYEKAVFPAGYCSASNSGGAQDNVRRFADVLGQVGAGVIGSNNAAAPVNGSTAATRKNHAVADWTSSVAGVDNQVAFETSQLSLLAQSSRFYSVSVDVVESSCDYLNGINNSRLQFALVVGGAERPINKAPIRACTDSRAKFYTSPVLSLGSDWDNGGKSARAGTFYSDGSSLLTPAELSAVRIRMRNETSQSEGNDFAFDNIRLLDVTPQLDKAFSPVHITQGQNTTLTYTVTNTSDLAAKNGWRFVDNLPAGLTATGALGGTCVRTTNTVTAGSVDVTGNLAAGNASCTITVTVTSNTPGNYNNSGCVANNGTAMPDCTNNFPTITGLNPPGTAPLTVLPVVGLSITKGANLSQYSPGSPITYTVAVHNNGPSDAINAVLTDPLPAAITGATWGCTVTDAGTATLPPLTGTTKCGAATGTGSITDTVRINTGGTLKYTITGTVTSGTSGNLVNKATIVPAATTTIPNMPGGGPNPIPDSTTSVTTVDPNCPPSPGVGCSATVTTPVLPIWDVKKTATVNGTTTDSTVVKAADVITYSVTAIGVRGQTSNAVLTDNLSNVLTNATFVAGSATLTKGAAASVAVPNPVAPANTLTTATFSLAPGEVATLRYQVTVKADVWNKTLVNVVTGAADTPPRHCVAGITPVQPECTTTHLTPAKVLIQKIGESGSPDVGWVPMDGSSWAVYDDDGGTQGELLAGSTVQKVPGEQGRFQLAGVPVGSYWLVETAAPDGFNLLAEPVQFTIAANGAVSIGQGAGGGVVTAGNPNSDGIYLITVRDVPALQLPESGGGGTMPFMLGGSFLLLAATALALRGQRHRRTLRSTTV